ncbi:MULTISPECIES: ABC transporter ATP-binding protein [Agrobacterium]|uniref:Amino acid/amide ABC transporter ATP-binding protein 2, HAAT family n=1 Tax=Agrobacterium fabrum TaxID=1176649 RepID=A0A7Z7BIZ7_9HYPH|nr:MULTISPECIES: ABC transporter ATP-binding protein [Agrobacterium]EGL64724.1 ABC transporter, nucleotide binding/ATPase protein [Agrobacterium sp. ATCC 31749]QKW96636.1 ATP-binding cassette domain-containing protein [Agrobacterium sp. CGMCC 11546]UXT57133.1 ABC transporter ATP-binding protein [Agrobacterium fabrum]WCK77358.1 ABC transporter ATP-binding protein [Agrobacterium fabrum]WIE28440.1 ABC transporter ATP-binding protein [Agrobacterium fabrum]
MSGNLLDIRDIHVAYGRAEVVHGISLSMAAGSIVTVIGANGAGKTTLLNAIMGVIPSRGTILYDGAPVPDTIEGRVAAGLCLVPEKRELFGSMTVEDNIELGGFLRSRQERNETREEVHALFPRLRERSKQLAGTLSGGERQMLALARALMSRPRLLLLDEPSLGLAPLIVAEILRIVAELRRTGVSILLVEQNARAALEIADEAYLVELGEVRRSGPAAELAVDPALMASYLGPGEHAV